MQGKVRSSILVWLPVGGNVCGEWAGAGRNGKSFNCTEFLKQPTLFHETGVPVVLTWVLTLLFV